LLSRLAQADPELVIATRHVVVDTTDTDAEAAATAWWEEMTSAGGEGMVVKPLENFSRGTRGIVQPALKVRGREYLRIIYGPDYTDSLDVLRDRHLGRKRQLAVREHGLGLDALAAFVDRRPLWAIHQAVFAILALESEPVDPRL
jgi:protein phosphatase